MNQQEAQALATYVYAALDRPVPTTTVAVWADIFVTLDYNLALCATRELLRTTPHVPHPADIFKQARLIENQRRRQGHVQQQLTARVARAESAPAVAQTSNWGVGMVRHVLGALKTAGQDPWRGELLGVDRAAEIAERAMRDFKAINPPPAAA